MPDGIRYEEDFLLWTQEQASLLRAEHAARSNVTIDWENLAEEIESLGRSQQRELRTRLERLLEHLLKLACCPATAPRDGWIDTVDEQRRAIDSLLHENPSLRPKLQDVVQSVSHQTRTYTARALDRCGEAAAAAMVRSGAYPEIERRVLDETFIPPPPQAPTSTST